MTTAGDRIIIEALAVRELAENPHLADWVRELREGDRRQGCGYMRTEDGLFCCLGVACDIAGVELVPIDEGFGVAVTETRTNDLVNDKVDLSHMPDWLRDTLGLTRLDETNLATLNDRQWSFDSIADVLELSFRASLPIFDAAHYLGIVI